MKRHVAFLTTGLVLLSILACNLPISTPAGLPTGPPETATREGQSPPPLLAPATQEPPPGPRMSSPASLIQPSDLVYLGAFRLPDARGTPDNVGWEWSNWASAMTYYPDGDPDGPDDDPDTYEDNNYRLSPHSPCVDAGKNEDWMWDAVDLDGNDRVWRGSVSWTVDIGAYEYSSFPFKIVDVIGGGDCHVHLTWNSRPGDSYVVQSCFDLLTEGWNVEATVTSQGELTTWTDGDPAFNRKFYRIEIE